MERRRRAEVDDLDIVHPQQLVKGPSTARNREFVAELGQPPLVEIADCQHPKLVGVPGITFGDVTAADAAPDDRDGPDPAL